MTEEETKRFMSWFRLAVESALKDIADCREAYNKWTNGFYRGCVIGQLAGLRRMVRSVDLPEEIHIDCIQAITGLDNLIEANKISV